MRFPDLLKPYRGLPRSIYVIFLAGVINSLGHFVWPFLTLFLTDKLGLSKTEAGLFVTLSALANVPGSLIGGKLADHVGRKKVFIIARALGTLALIPCAFLGRSMAIPWLMIVSGVLNGASEPAMAAMLGDLTNRRNRQAAFSLLYLGHNIGAAVGPTLAGLLYRRHLPWIFLGDALTTLLSLVLTGMFVKETLHSRAMSEADDPELTPNERAEEGGLIPVLLRRPALLVFSLIMMAYAFVYVQGSFSLPVQLAETFKQDGPRLYGTLWSVNATIVVLLTTAVTRYTTRFSPTQNIGAGGLFFAVGFGMIVMTRNVSQLMISTFIWTLGEILVTTNTGAYIANNTPVSHRGRFNAVHETISGAGFALGPVIMGRFIDNYGVGGVWPVSFFLVSGGAALMFLLWAAERTHARRNALSPAGDTPVGGAVIPERLLNEAIKEESC